MRAVISTLPAVLLLAACASEPIVVPAAAGRSASEVASLVAASEARFFGCSISRVVGADGTTLEIGRRRPEVTLPPGRYRVTLHCTNSAGHSSEPFVDLSARAGKRYQVTGYFVDDSITIWNMRMQVKVSELP